MSYNMSELQTKSHIVSSCSDKSTTSLLGSRQVSPNLKLSRQVSPGLQTNLQESSQVSPCLLESRHVSSQVSPNLLGSRDLYHKPPAFQTSLTRFRFSLLQLFFHIHYSSHFSIPFSNNVMYVYIELH